MSDYSDYGINLNGKSGEEVSTLCPKCSHTRSAAGQKKPCLRVNTVKGTWFCHHPSCGWKGGLGQAVRTNVEPRRHAVIAYSPQPVRDPRLIEWFHRRGISEEVVAAHAIGLQRRYFAAVGEVDAITFPYFYEGVPVNCKYRSLDGKEFSQEKGGLKVLYGIDGLSEGVERAVLVEGEIDKLSLEVAGIRCGLSVPDGAPAPCSKGTDLKFEYLQTCKKQLDTLTKIIIAVDNDGPGKTLEAELIRRLGPDRCWRVTWPEGCKDANDVLLKHGADELRRCVDAAKPMPIEGVVSVEDVSGDLDLYFERGATKGVSTGLPGMDRVYLPRTGEWTCLVGMPGHGKSTFIESMLVSMAQKHDWSFAVCSPESWPVERHKLKFIEKYVGAPGSWRSGRKMTDAQYLKGKKWVGEHFFSIAPKEMVSIEAVLKIAKSMVQKHGIRGLLIDPYNAFMKKKQQYERDDEYLAPLLNKVLDFCRECDVHTWIVVHPHALEKQKVIKDKAVHFEYPVVTPYDVNGGAMFFNKAFHFLSAYKPDPAGDLMDVHHQKCKFWHETGVPGMVSLRLDPYTFQYSEVPNN